MREIDKNGLIAYSDTPQHGVNYIFNSDKNTPEKVTSCTHFIVVRKYGTIKTIRLDL